MLPLRRSARLLERSSTSPKDESPTELPERGRPSERPITSSSRTARARERRVIKVTQATSFDIEFKFVLAFHEDKLKEVLPMVSTNGIEPQIVKKISDLARHDLLLKHEQVIAKSPAYMCRLLWPSWLLNVSSDDQSIAVDAARKTVYATDDPRPGSNRRYVIEPLLIAQSAVNAYQRTYPGPMAIAWIEESPDATCNGIPLGSPSQPAWLQAYWAPNSGNSRQWIVTNDHSIAPASKCQMMERLLKYGIADQAGKWDSHGIELISPIYGFAEIHRAIIEIDRHLKALTAEDNESKVDLLRSVWAKPHIHIGFDQDTAEGLSVRFFQHVAFILITHEDLVTRCFPRSCSGVPPSGGDPQAPPITKSGTEDGMLTNATIVENERAVIAAERAYTGHDHIRSNAKHLREILSTRLHKPEEEIRWTDVRDAIFMEHGTLTDLIKLLQSPVDPLANPDGQRNPNYMVNWANIWALATSDEPSTGGGGGGGGSGRYPKPTLEFRQHPCIVQTRHLLPWLNLLRAVTAVAAEKSLQTTTYGSPSPLDRNGTYAQREADKYANQGRPFGSIGDYVRRLLKVSAREVGYWEGRYAQYENDR